MLTTTSLEKAGRAVEDFHDLIGLGLINAGGEFVSTLQYPPMTQYPAMKEEDFLKGYLPAPGEPLVVYAHIPFCMQLCSFCHYPNIVAVSDSEKDVYLDHLDKEMGIYLGRLGLGRAKARSILIGGGTPTFLTPAQLDRFLARFTSRLEIGPSAPFSCDLDPLTVIGYEGRERLKALKSFGVNRVSMGIQSFSDDMLRSMNRHHNTADTIRAIAQVKELGLELDVELIYGYPGETEERWARTLRQAVSYEVDEIMIYRLKIIPNAVKEGAITGLRGRRGDMLLSNDEDVRLKAIALDILEESGYAETLSRCFSRDPGGFSHYLYDTMVYQLDTAGFGCYAMSKLRDRSAQNTYDMKEYLAAVRDGRLPVKTGMLRTRDQQLRRNLILPLKQRELSKKQYLERTGAGAGAVFGDKLDLLKRYGLLEEDAEFLRLTRKGRFFSDEVTQLFYHPDCLPFPKEKYKDGPLNPYLDNGTLVR